MTNVLAHLGPEKYSDFDFDHFSFDSSSADHLEGSSQVIVKSRLRACAPKRKAPISGAEPIIKTVKLIETNCAGKLFNDCIPTDNLTSKVDAIYNSGSMIIGCVVGPMDENSAGKLALDSGSQTVYSTF